MEAAHAVPTVPSGDAAPTRSPRDRLIEAATRLFCRSGVNSVGVDTADRACAAILSEARMSKRG